RIPSGGGAFTKLTQLDAGKEFIHTFPQLLPGGKGLLFTSYAVPPDLENANIEVYTLADQRRKVLVRGATYGRYISATAHAGHLLYGNRGTVFAVPFDLDALEVRGTPVPVVDDVSNDAASSKPQIEISSSGLAVYRPGAGGGSGLMT